MSDDLTPKERAARRRRLARIFGEVLPDQTTDDIDDASEDRRTGEQAQEDWLKRQVPPHHG